MRRIVFIGFILLLFFIILSTSPIACADGGGYTTVVDYEEHIYLPEQKAAIFWNGTHETLVISTKIKSDYFSDKAWVIPIKSSSKPEVDVADTELFYDIAEAFEEHVDLDKNNLTFYEMCIILLIIFIIGLFLLIIGYFTKKLTGVLVIVFLIIWLVSFVAIGFLIIYSSSGMMGASDSGYADVELVDFKKVDIYDVATLKATNATQLVGWLNDNGFFVPESSVPIIQSYCDQDDFYFIVNKINLTNKYTTETQIQNAISKLNEGIETPLMIKFQPEQPFYPMKMSSINEGNTKINVYFISNYSVTDDSGYLSFKRTNDVFVGISRWFEDDPTYDYERISMLTFEGNTKDLTEDSYFIKN